MDQIDIHIPYHPNRHLGTCYNRIMGSSNGWVLFFDHDVFLLNPNWYKICLDATIKLGHDAGWITCRTNRVGCLQQRVSIRKDTDDLKYHYRISKRIWEKHGDESVEMQRMYKKKLSLPSGFFMLTHKKAWQDIGGFREGFIGVDNDYALDLWDKGYKIHILMGLYVYHQYNRIWKW